MGFGKEIIHIILFFFYFYVFIDFSKKYNIMFKLNQILIRIYNFSYKVIDQRGKKI